ncbi:MAG: M61 family metallopeptidase [Calditrichaeota bacterium]|nr:M61 family metallopeptidase [Calditrichota bacterium]
MSNLVVMLIFIFCTFAQVKVKHEVFIPDDNSHFIHVKSTITNVKKPSLEFHLPVWTPGHYFNREYSKNVYEVKASAGNKNLKLYKIRKNIWKVESNNASTVTFEYDVFGFERSVRTNHFTDEHAFIVPASTFTFLPEMLSDGVDISLKIHLNKSFKKVATGLGYGNRTEFTSNNLDVFYDSPIEVGNFNESEFEIDGVKHRIAIFEHGNYNLEELTKEVKSVTQTIIDFFDGQIPYEHYTYMVNLQRNSGGAIEHLNSTAMLYSPDRFHTLEARKGFLGTAAHEFFHTWNVKRIRPIELGPFNYDDENYTTMLWLSEGWTSYIGDMTMLWAGFEDNDSQLRSTGRSVGSVYSSGGYKHQTLSESSFDAWIRAYRYQEIRIASSTTVSYYGYGAIIGLVIDLKIIEMTNGKKSIKDLFLALYDRFKSNPKVGITFDELKSIAAKVAGGSLDKEFDYVNSNEKIDFNQYLKTIGKQLEEMPKGTEPSFGFRTRNGEIVDFNINSYLAKSGLSLEDEMVSIDEHAVKDNYNDVLEKYYKVGDKVNVTVDRHGRLHTYEITLQNDDFVRYKMVDVDKPSDRQKEMLENWLKKR